MNSWIFRRVAMQSLFIADFPHVNIKDPFQSGWVVECGNRCAVEQFLCFSILFETFTFTINYGYSLHICVFTRISRSLSICTGVWIRLDTNQTDPKRRTMACQCNGTTWLQWWSNELWWILGKKKNNLNNFSMRNWVLNCYIPTEPMGEK